MNLQIETISTNGGAKVDAIRDIESVRKLIARNAELEAENTRLWRENDANAFKIAPATYEARIDQLEKERDAWKECADILRQRARHSYACRMSDEDSCDCGLEEAVYAFDKLKGQK